MKAGFSDTAQQGVPRGRPLFVWALCCVIAGIVFIVYVLTSLRAGQGELVMPLDDVYIHFQYARQMAAGQPYIYNPGLPPTSGATSFLYPWLLAVGHLIGFQGLNLGLWAMGIGALALAGSAWLVYRLMERFSAGWRLSALWAMGFVLAGPVAWHFMSGMETGLVVLFGLGTLYSLTPCPSLNSGERVSNTISIALWAAGLALVRPEGGILALLAVGAAWIILPRPLIPSTSYGEPWKARRRAGIWWLLLPVLAVSVQPVVNLLVTGSAVASGNAAKSILGTVPFDWGAVIVRILGNFGRMWSEFFTGSSAREGMYFAPFMGLLALVGLGVILSGRWHVASLQEWRNWRIIGLMLVGWLLAGTLAIATLDTAFWHFKRYQMPFVVVMWVLAGWGIEVVSNQLSVISKRPLIGKYFQYGIAGVIGVVSLWTGGQFLGHYALNVGYVAAQPLQMARWLQANTPPEAVVAVHDTGLLRYEGGRTTIDMVGLTTPGAADYWRNGPGAVAEFLMRERPDYIASYGHGHGYGLGMLADTSLYGEPLAGFPVALDTNFNVALAADFQGVYQPDWDENQFNYDYKAMQPYGDYIFTPEGSLPSTYVDVADIESEKLSNYRWQNQKSDSSIGFSSEIHEFNYFHCVFAECRLVDAGRRITGEESFTMKVFYDSGRGWDVVIVTRVHAQYAGSFDVYANGQLVGTRVIPEIPGQWLEIPTFIPHSIARMYTDIRIVPHMNNGFYMPYFHMAYSKPIEPKPTKILSTFQFGAIVLAEAKIEYQPVEQDMKLNIQWYTDGSAQGDYKVFVHVLNENDEIVAQTDVYPGNGMLPPGNWLPGVLRDTITVNLGDVPPGSYRVAMGLYNPYSFERLQPEGGDGQKRFFIGDVEIP